MRKIELLQVELRKEILWAFRLVMLLVAWPFISDIYFAFMTGSIEFRGNTVVRGESPIFYARIIKKAAFVILLLWLASFGSIAKKDRTEAEDS